VLRPVSIEAQPQAWLTGALFGITAVVFILTSAALIAALVRQNPRPPTPATGSAQDDRGRIRAVVTAVGATAVVLAVVVAASLAAGPHRERAGPPDALAVEITGHLWWWEITYLAPPGGTAVTTANELHLPAGRPVDVYLRSADVIHSFWAPSLGGKTDLVPARPGHFRMTPTEPGEFSGFCAEFCGLEHARMRLTVLVDAPDTFERWLADEARTARAPTAPMEEEGRGVFLASPCVGCHTIRGVSGGGIGPDLTHVGSRRTLAGGIVPNTPESLSRWVRHARTMKPGSLMPDQSLTEAQVASLVAYLQSLQ